MGKHNDGSAGFQMLDIAFEPLQLLVPQRAEAAGLEIDHIHQADKMHTVLVETVPALALEVFPVAFSEHGSVIIQDVVFSGYEKDFLVSGLEDLVNVVKLFGLGEMTDVAGVQNELRRVGKGIYLVHGGLERGNHIRICGLVESHVAIADLNETQLPCCVHLCSRWLL